VKGKFKEKEKPTMNAIRRISLSTLAGIMMILLASLCAVAQTSGTPGKIAKFKSPNALGDSVITEDKDGRVGIGTALPTSRLTVQGVVEALSGFKFPDGTVQTTSAAGALVSVAHDSTLTGNGTAASPLGVASPLLVRDLDNPARQPYQAIASATSTTPVLITTVPSGKRLVIEYISALMNVPSGRLAFSLLAIQEGATLVFGHRLVLTKIGTPAPDIDAYEVSQPFRMYLNAGQTLSLTLLTSNSSLSVFITGHYVDDIP
jgi:hypothetical protein